MHNWNLTFRILSSQFLAFVQKFKSNQRGVKTIHAIAACLAHLSISHQQINLFDKLAPYTVETTKWEQPEYSTEIQWMDISALEGNQQVCIILFAAIL